jgi:hypothetical protein
VSGRQLLALKNKAVTAYEICESVISVLVSADSNCTTIVAPYRQLLYEAYGELRIAMGQGRESVVLEFLEESAALAALPTFELPGKGDIFQTATAAIARVIRRLLLSLHKYIDGKNSAIELREAMAANQAIDFAQCKQRVISEYGIALRQLEALRNRDNISLTNLQNGDAIVPLQGVTPGSLAELLKVSPATVRRYADQAGVTRPKPGVKGKLYSLADVVAILETFVSRSPRDTKRAAWLLANVKRPVAAIHVQDSAFQKAVNRR